MTLSVTQVQTSETIKGLSPCALSPHRRARLVTASQGRSISGEPGRSRDLILEDQAGFRVLERRATPLISHGCAASFQSSRVVSRLPARAGHETGMGELGMVCE